MPGVDLSRVYFVANYDETDFSTKTAELVRRFQREEGVDYWTGNVGFGYDAMMVLAHAMRLANDPTNGSEVRDILANRTSRVQGSTSLITLNPRTHRPIDVPLFIGRHFAQSGIEIISSIVVNESDITW
jgi:ABC-type branched-subunit amino acid transport system substrate-binding protein